MTRSEDDMMKPVDRVKLITWLVKMMEGTEGNPERKGEDLAFRIAFSKLIYGDFDYDDTDTKKGATIQ